MADVFTLTGVLQTTPTDPSASGLASILAQISETLMLTTRCVPGEYDLAADPAVNVSLGSLTGVNVLWVKSTGKIKLAITSADGASQIVPVDGVHLTISRTTPITAITIQRVPGVETFVDIILGQAA